MQYDDFVKFCFFIFVIFVLIHYMIKSQSQIINHIVQYWLCLLWESPYVNHLFHNLCCHSKY